MATDLNRMAERMKKQKPVGVTRSGTVTDVDPRNSGTSELMAGNTTLNPERFFRA